MASEVFTAKEGSVNVSNALSEGRKSLSMNRSGGTRISVTQSRDKNANNIMQSMSSYVKLSGVYGSSASVDDFVRKVGNEYEMKVWNTLGRNTFEIAPKSNNTDVSLRFKKNGRSWTVTKNTRRYYGLPNLSETVFTKLK